MSQPAYNSVDPEEVARFAALADSWWNLKGPYAPLHGLTPTRVLYIKEQIASHFSRDFNSIRALENLTVLDIGCGGGLLAEPLARLGASVTGIDPAEENIGVARSHAAGQNLSIDYQAKTAEDIAATGQTFDIVIASEVIEHVNDPSEFIRTMAALTKPGGLVMLSTINRTVKSFALAIVGAEYILRWLPRGTHTWSKFVTPQEMENYASAAGLTICDTSGMIFNPLRGSWSLGRDKDVNYWLTGKK